MGVNPRTGKRQQKVGEKGGREKRDEGLEMARVEGIPLLYLYHHTHTILLCSLVMVVRGDTDS
jgi:hypothetical protein